MNEHLCFLVGLHFTACSQHYCGGSGPFHCVHLLELYTFLLIMCINSPESTTNSRSSDLVEVGAGITFASIGEKKDFVRILELVNIFRQIPRCSAGASFLVQGLLVRSFPHVWRARTTLIRRTLLGDPSRWTLSFPIFFLYFVPDALGLLWSQFSWFT